MSDWDKLKENIIAIPIGPTSLIFEVADKRIKELEDALAEFRRFMELAHPNEFPGLVSIIEEALKT